MYAALYYPHASLQKPEFAKMALLPWDKMNYISPFRGYPPYYKDSALAEAAEILTVQHVPSEDEKHKAHAEIERRVRLASSPTRLRIHSAFIAIASNTSVTAAAEHRNNRRPWR